MMIENRQAAASFQGREFEKHAARALIANGYDIITKNWTEPGLGVEIDIVAAKPGDSTTLWVECKGSWESDRNGIQRTDTLKKAIASAWIVSLLKPYEVRYVLITSDLPKRESVGEGWLAVAREYNLFDDVWHLPMGYTSLQHPHTPQTSWGF